MKCIIGTTVGEAKVSFEYFLTSRILIIAGFSVSAYEFIIISTVGDLFLVHQRGFRIAFIGLVLNAGSMLASIMIHPWTSFREYGLALAISSLSDISRYPIHTHASLLPGDYAYT